MAHEKVKFYFTFFFAIIGGESRTFSTSNILNLNISNGKVKIYFTFFFNIYF